MASLLRRIVLAVECYDAPARPGAVAPAPMDPGTCLGALVGHVVKTLARDRRLLDSWLDEGSRTIA
jgi:hypothetical protein